MLKRMAVVIVAVLALATFVMPPAADADDKCPVFPLPVFTAEGEELTGEDLVEEAREQLDSDEEILEYLQQLAQVIQEGPLEADDEAVREAAEFLNFIVDTAAWFEFQLGPGCGPALTYPKFDTHPPAAVGPYGWGAVSPQAAAPAAVPVPDAGVVALAVTGAETHLATVGVSLIAAGAAATAFGARRRRHDEVGA